MQIILLILLYFSAMVINNYQRRKVKDDLIAHSKKLPWARFIKSLPAILLGISGVMLADWLSQGEPLWPAIAIVIMVAGERFPIPITKRFQRNAEDERSGILSYIGGIFYLNPLLALICLSFSLEMLLVGKDGLLATLIFIGLVPVLIGYAQMNPVFLWISVLTEVIILWGLKKELLNKIKPVLKNG